MQFAPWLALYNLTHDLIESDGEVSFSGFEVDVTSEPFTGVWTILAIPIEAPVTQQLPCVSSAFQTHSIEEYPEALFFAEADWSYSVWISADKAAGQL